MLHLKLSTLAIGLGAIVALPSIYGVVNPTAFAAAARRFPRFTPAGYPLMLLATLWFLHYLSLESVSDFLSFKPALYALFACVGIGACVFVRDFLPVRALAALMLLLAKLMVDTARWAETDWRLVITTWAYAMILAGMWFTVSPWRMRDLLQWGTATVERTRWLSGLRLAFALFVVLLGLTVYRSAEKTAQPQAGLRPGTTASTDAAPAPLPLS